MTKTITLIEGDGIGPEITAQVVRVLNAAGAPLSFDRQSLGQKAWEQPPVPRRLARASAA